MRARGSSLHSAKDMHIHPRIFCTHRTITISPYQKVRYTPKKRDISHNPAYSHQAQFFHHQPIAFRAGNAPIPNRVVVSRAEIKVEAGLICSFSSAGVLFRLGYCGAGCEWEAEVVRMGKEVWGSVLLGDFSAI